MPTVQQPDEALLTAPPEEAIRELTPSAVLFRQEHTRLQLRLEGEEEWRDVTLARLFPLSDPDGWIAVVDKDDKEIGILETLHGLPPESLACVRAELHRRYMVPEIRRILACKDRFDLLEWEVETDRGPAAILMRHPQESIKQLIPGRYSLTDVEGNRYDIPNLSTLDAESRRLLEFRL